MKNLETFHNLVKAGSLVAPLNHQTNQISIAHAISHFAGNFTPTIDKNALELLEQFDSSDHLLMLLVDGLGMNFVNRMSQNSFIRSNLWKTGNSVFPSSTGPNLLSLSTGTWPGRHGDLGWKTYLDNIKEPATLLKWERSRDSKNLLELNVSPDSVFLERPLVVEYKLDYVFLVPKEYQNAPVTGWISNGRVLPYDNLSDALQMAKNRIKESKDRTFTYIYWPDVDFVTHQTGCESLETASKLHYLENTLVDFFNNVFGKVSFLLTSDHGHMDVPEDKRIIVGFDDPLNNFINNPISGEEKFVFLRLGDHREKFIDLFMDRFQDYFMVLSPEDILDLSLLGPDVKDEVNTRLGDTVLLSKGVWAIDFRTNDSYKSEAYMISNHGGLTHDEMQIPIVYYRT